MGASACLGAKVDGGSTSWEMDAASLVDELVRGGLLGEEDGPKLTELVDVNRDKKINSEEWFSFVNHVLNNVMSAAEANATVAENVSSLIGPDPRVGSTYVDALDDAQTHAHFTPPALVMDQSNVKEKWHFFLSHYQANAGDLCLCLVEGLRLRCCGNLRVWFDQDCDATEVRREERGVEPRVRV